MVVAHSGPSCLVCYHSGCEQCQVCSYNDGINCFVCDGGFCLQCFAGFDRRNHVRKCAPWVVDKVKSLIAVEEDKDWFD